MSIYTNFVKIYLTQLYIFCPYIPQSIQFIYFYKMDQKIVI